MKRIISLILSLTMILALVPFSALSVGAETSTDSQGVTYTLSDDETYYIVSDCVTSATWVVIPETYNGLPVKEIGWSAFYDCENLTNIEIPNSITSVIDWAFQSCVSLTNIKIPDSVTHIGVSVFFGCSSLETITVASGNDTYHSDGNCIIETESKTLVAGCNNSFIPTDGSVISIGNSSFAYCKNLTNIEIPDSITYIGDYAFAYCKNLTSIEIPDSLTTIGDRAFAYCSNLTSIEIPDSVTYIGDKAFYYCRDLTSIEIPDSVTYVGEWAFGACNSLTDIYCKADSQPEGWDAYWNSICDATVHWSTKIIGSVENSAKGDLNGNGGIDSMDYLYLKRAYFKQYFLSDTAVGDINGNGGIDSMDYLYLKRAYFKQYIIDDDVIVQPDTDDTNDDIVVQPDTDNLEWTWTNGGDDYIIKTNGKTEIIIPVDISMYEDKIPSDDEFYITGTEIKRSNFHYIDGWLYFHQSIYCYDIQIKDDPNSENIGSFAVHPCYSTMRMREDGSEIEEVAVDWIAGYNEKTIYFFERNNMVPEFGTLYKMDISNGIENAINNKVQLTNTNDLVPTSSYYKDGKIYCQYEGGHPFSGEKVEDWEINLADYE